MKGFQVVLFLFGFVGSLYLVKNIKITVSGAEAYSEDSEMREPNFDDEFDSSQSMSSTSQANQNDQQITPASNDEVQIMIQFMKQQKLCEFSKFVKEKNISTSKQFKALEMSLSNPLIKELEVLNDVGIDRMSSYFTLGSKFYLLADELSAFESVQLTRSKDYNEGISEKHQNQLNVINQLERQDSENVIYSFLKGQIYIHYNNISEELKQQIFDEVLTKSYYENPIFNRMQKLYQLAKSNVVHFYLAQNLLESNFTIDQYFAQRILWNFYAPELREHLANIYQKYFDSVTESHHSFGYEPDIYEAYRSAVPYEIYESMFARSEYDKNLIQPTYSLEDLGIDLSESCSEEQVEELKIKLRAM